MTPREHVTTFRMDDALLDAMEQLREREGIPFSEQIRRGLRLFFESKGIVVKAERPRARTRKRS